MNGHGEPRYQMPDNPQRQRQYEHNPRLVYRPIFRDEQGGSAPRPPPSRRDGSGRSWSGLFAFALLLIAAVVILLNLDEIKAFFATMEDAGSHDPVRQFKGLATFGIVVVSILAAMRIALNRRDDDRGSR